MESSPLPVPAIRDSVVYNTLQSPPFGQLFTAAHEGTWRTMHCRLSLNCYGIAQLGGRGGGGWEGVASPLPHTHSTSGSATINVKTTLHCSPGSSMIPPHSNSFDYCLRRLAFVFGLSLPLCTVVCILYLLLILYPRICKLATSFSFKVPHLSLRSYIAGFPSLYSFKGVTRIGRLLTCMDRSGKNRDRGGVEGDSPMYDDGN